MFKSSVYTVVFIVTMFCDFGCRNNRQIVKEITINRYAFNDKLTKLCWYKESYITNRREFVGLKIDGGDEQILLFCDDAEITNIDLKTDTVFIKIYTTDSSFYKKQPKIGRYSVIVQESSYEDWFKFYHPGEKFYPIKFPDKEEP